MKLAINLEVWSTKYKYAQNNIQEEGTILICRSIINFKNFFFILQQREQINKDTRLKMLLDVSYYPRTCHVFEYSALHVLVGYRCMFGYLLYHVWL